MTQEEKQLLLKDLCARLPYGAFVFIRKPFGCVMSETEEEELTATTLQEFIENDDMHVFPYLRPMSSMTFKETREFLSIKNGECKEYLLTTDKQDWLNEHHFDYRGLIEKGIAIEAPEGMYNS